MNKELVRCRHNCCNYLGEMENEIYIVSGRLLLWKRSERGSRALTQDSHRMISGYKDNNI